MEDFQHVVYSKEVVEFVAVAKEFCDFVETAPQMSDKEFLPRLQKFIPLIYLKGALLPMSEPEERHDGGFRDGGELQLPPCPDFRADGGVGRVSGGVR